MLPMRRDSGSDGLAPAVGWPARYSSSTILSKPRPALHAALTISGATCPWITSAIIAHIRLRKSSDDEMPSFASWRLAAFALTP